MSTQNLLHIDSSILGPHSVSRQLTASVVEKLRRTSPGLAVTYRDLSATPLPHLSGPVFAAVSSGQAPQDPALAAELAVGEQVLGEFLAADIIVLGAGFYNFGVPSQLKAWVDRIVVPGKTFHYTAEGRPAGLAGGKRLILVIARGGYYSAGTPMATFEHAETYLRNVLGFLGVTDVEVVAAEGVAIGPEARQSGIAQAQAVIEALA